MGQRHGTRLPANNKCVRDTRQTAWDSGAGQEASGTKQCVTSARQQQHNICHYNKTNSNGTLQQQKSEIKTITYGQ